MSLLYVQCSLCVSTQDENFGGTVSMLFQSATRYNTSACNSSKAIIFWSNNLQRIPRSHILQRLETAGRVHFRKYFAGYTLSTACLILSLLVKLFKMKCQIYITYIASFVIAIYECGWFPVLSTVPEGLVFLNA